VGNASSGRRRRTAPPLSPRQLEVAKLLQRGLSVAEVARELWLEDGTVKTHVARIYAALGISSRAELGQFALAHWAHPRVCGDCGDDFTPTREDGRFCSQRCARAAARQTRREASAPKRSERAAVRAWISAAQGRAQSIIDARDPRSRAAAVSG
jgi:DNA-binding CsgD family transcriptional regulator